jgi:hypothetical protein
LNFCIIPYYSILPGGSISYSLPFKGDGNGSPLRAVSIPLLLVSLLRKDYTAGKFTNISVPLYEESVKISPLYLLK